MILGIFGFLVIVSVNPVYATHVNCGDSINTSTTLDSDLLNCSGNAIMINADDITLDCQEHVINGTRTPSNYGIVAYGRKNIIIKNCIIRNFEIGTRFELTSQSQLSNNIAYDNIAMGFLLALSSNDTLKNNSANNSAYGFYLNLISQNNILINNSANNGYYGFALDTYCSNNSLTFNTANNNSEGFSLSSSCYYNTLISNIANNNNKGFYLDNSRYNVLVNNTADNNVYGLNLDSTPNIYHYPSAYNNVTSNVIQNNNNGILLVGGPLNTIKSNLIKNNNLGISILNSNGNLIYDNYFANALNAWDDRFNFWNITKTLGTNIIDGPYLGGNFWHDYNGLDRNGDGLGNTLLPYNSNENITNGGDFLPLTSSGELCGIIVNSSTVLTSDVTNCIRNGLEIRASNVVLDCNGHAISGTNTFSTAGVYIDRQNNVTIKNCKINNFFWGIHSQHNIGNIITNNEISLDTVGISFYNSSFDSVNENNITKNINGGIISYSSTGNEIFHNNFIDNGIQVYDDSSTNKYSKFLTREEGNSWSNYNKPSNGCNDNNFDGFCDAPYTVPSSTSKDLAPFSTIDGWKATDVDLSINRIEVTQATQNFTFPVSLVEGKLTVVRVYVDIGPTAKQFVTNVNGTINAYRNDIELISSPQKPKNDVIFSQIGAKKTLDRNNKDDTLNFILPKDWLFGNITINITINTERKVSEFNYNNNQFVKSLNFNKQSPLNIYFVMVRDERTGLETKGLDRVQLIDYINRVYPIEDVNFSDVHPNSINVPSWWPRFGINGLGGVFDYVLTQLWLRRISDIAHNRVSQRTKYYGMVHNGVDTGIEIGKATLFSKIVESSEAAGKITQFESGQIAAHEIGHLFERRHVLCAGEDDIDVGYPYADGKIGQTGFDVINYIQGRDAIYPNNTSKDYMSYCFLDAWTSDYTFNALFEKFNVSPITSMDTFSLEQLQINQNYIAISGYILTDNSTSFNNFFIQNMQTGTYDYEGTGNYSIELLNSNQNLLFKRSFEIEFLENSNSSSFSEVIPYDNTTSTILFKRNSTILLSRNVSSNKPSVSVLSPNGGENISGSFNIMWTAMDLDNNSLTYNVLYSPDGGLSWVTLAVDLNQTSYSWDTTTASGTNNGLIRIIVSDGVNTIENTSIQYFQISKKTPESLIILPENNSVFDEGSTTILSGRAFDAEDSQLSNKNLRWYSDKNGFLGNGSQIQINNLTIGTHTITLSANDSDGNIANSSITITVNDTIPITINMLSPIDDLFFAHSVVPISFEINEDTSWIGYSLDNNPNVTISTTNFKLDFNRVALHNITIYANDTSGGMGRSDTIVFHTCVGDINRDNKITILDIARAAFAFDKKAGQTGYDFPSDIDEDGDVDIFDLSAMAVNYGKTCP